MELQEMYFFKRKRKYSEALIMAKLENLQLARSLSFMTPQARPGDITAINIPKTNADKSQKQVVGNGEEVVSKKPAAALIESQPTTKQSKAGLQIPEKALNKEDTVKGNPTRSVQLPNADIAVRNDKTNNNISTGEALTKPGNPQTDPLQKTDKKIPETILKEDHSTGSKDTIKKVLLPVTEMPKPKNETAAIVPIKTGTAQISKPVEADKKIPNKVEKKEESGVNKGIIKQAPSLIIGTPAPKNELAINESAKSEPQQIDKQQKAGKIISGAGLNKVDSAVNKNIVKMAPSLKKPAKK